MDGDVEREGALAGRIQVLFTERERVYERLALAAHEHGDVATREAAARLQGELSGIRRVATLLGVEIAEHGVAFLPD